ncbi:26S proteasome non-ATPase regulatory subunit 3 homolog A-like [Durio zibethinus]|uniref:26S proteasome non-ATPase regulatory subunit 3 homolog A-like n=1 Tax=Durio zibethinus TaxID=66656 RepID=A0A6P5ZNB6_DURZI|nr:26S proteasome non-ATPase regulatory subunit 3 homolog A-like [Durio zibethinus]
MTQSSVFVHHSSFKVLKWAQLTIQGKIRTIQLEYTDAKESQSPPCSLRLQNSKGMEKTLTPYFELTNVSLVVRIGDLELFRTVAEKFASTVGTDKTHNLIECLRHNVIRTGLRNISASYSRISLADVAEKLRLNSETPVADAESIVAKAIGDGAIDATLDHALTCTMKHSSGLAFSTKHT